MNILITALSFSTAVILCDVYGHATRSRVKRIVNGAPELDIKGSEYLSVRYYVYLAFVHNCDNIPEQTKDGTKRICPPAVDDFRGAGSLLTPFAVQTACHVVAQIYDKNKTVIINSSWEKIFILYPSKAHIEEMNEGALSKNFYHHPQCGQGPYSYDFGLIIADSAIEFPGVVYVPLYTVADLAKVWIESQSKRKVCLVIGFGNICQGNLGCEYVLSRYMRAVWQTAADYRSCYKRFIFYKIPNYEEAVSWICTHAFPGANVTNSASGDSGGPVTCDNAYAGIVSQSGIDVGIQMSPTFTPLENAAEYRVKFSYAITELYLNDPLEHWHPTGTILVNLNQTSLSNTGSQTSGIMGCVVMMMYLLL